MIQPSKAPSPILFTLYGIFSSSIYTLLKNAFGEIELYKNRKLFEASAEKFDADPMSRFTQFNFPNELGQQISLNLTIPVTAQIGDDALGTQIVKSEKDMQIRGGGK